MENFYDRTERLLGADAVAKLARAHVVVLGVGGVGSWATEALARAGIGALTLVDFDRIEPSNLNRQVHALTSTIGRLKVEVMAERLIQINPALTIHTHAERLLPEALP